MPRFRSISKRLKDQAEPPGHYSFGTQWYGGPQYTDPNRSRLAPSPWQLVENYNALIYAMVARNRNAVTRLPLRLYADGSRAQGKPRSCCEPIKVSRHVAERLASTGAVSKSAVSNVYEVRTHPFLDTLEKPDPDGFFTKEKLIGLMVSYPDVVGWFQLVPEGNGWDWRNPGKRKGPPEYLWVIYPQYTIPIRRPASPQVDHWQYFADRLPASETIWFRHNLSLRDSWGGAFSPTYAGETYRYEEQEQVQNVAQVLGLGPRPNVIASAKDPAMPPGKPEALRLEQDFYRRQSAANAGGLWVNTGAWEFTPVSYSPADLGGKEFAEYALYNLAAIFDQPPTYYTVDSNLANLEAADKQHATRGVEPRCRSIEGTLNNVVKQWDPRLFFRFDPAIPEDEESRMKVVDMRLKAGLTTPNQENEESQWPPFEGGDEHWVPNSLTTMNMIIEQHELSKQQGQAAMEQGAAKMENESTATEFQYGDGASDEADVEAVRNLSDADVVALCAKMLEQVA